VCAVLAGISGFLYAVAFIIIQQSAPATGAFLSALFLLLLGLLSSAAQVGVYSRLRDAAPAFALWALILAMVAAFGSTIHGGYDLANALNPPSTPNIDLPSQVDPRGLLTFGFAGLSVGAFSLLMRSFGAWPRTLVYIGFASALLLVLIYLLRLIVPSSVIVLAPAALEGFIVNPVWYLWLGLELRRGG